MKMIGWYPIKKMLLGIFLILLSSFLVACPSQPPCDEEIDNPEIYEELVLDHPVIKQLGMEFNISQADAYFCFVNGKVDVAVEYQIPSTYSQFDLVYSDMLLIAYPKEGDNIELVERFATQPKVLEYDTIVNSVKDRIQKIENDARIREFVDKIDLQENPIRLSSPSVTLYGVPDRITYNLSSGSVSSYMLSGELEWEQFPEIDQAHQIVEQELLTGDFTGCEVDYSEHSYIVVEPSNTGEIDSLRVTVKLNCGNDGKNIVFILKPDGSYEKLGRQLDESPSPP